VDEMPGSRWIWLLPIAAAAAVVVVLVSSDEDGGPDTTRTAGELPAGAPAPPFGDGKSGDDGSGTPAVRAPDEERAALRAVRDYLEAIDARDGAAVCAVLAPGAIQNFQLPRQGGGCAQAVGASIGYRDPRGFPVFESARIDSIGDVALGAGQGRATATVVTRFADRDEPSIEDDPIYLARVGEGWRVAKPSLTFYRAIGREPPPEALGAP
jgi:ketosteroid isomerase-like protein